MKSKTKKVKIPLANDRDISELFNQMLGTGVANLKLAYPRYVDNRELCERIVKVFKLLADSPTLNNMTEYRREILEYTENCEANIRALFNINLDEYQLDFEKTPKELAEQFTVKYEEMKKAPFIKSLIYIADNLYPYRTNFANVDKLNHIFIFDISGITWKPFPFSLDVKEIVYTDNISKSHIEFIMTVICKIYEFTFKLYENMRTPDIDIDQFIDIIIASIDKIQKMPELNRCDKAFRKIKESVRLLKTNFNDYYRDFLETQDNTIIMQNFVIDVSKNTKADLEMTRQFRKIISYYREISQKTDGVQNEKMNMLFDKLNSTFKDFDTQNIGVQKPDESAKPEDEKK
jgi:hypothetical protein